MTCPVTGVVFPYHAHRSLSASSRSFPHHRHRHIAGGMAFPNNELLFTDNNLYDIVANQIQEMELVRSKIYQLEQTHVQMKQKYVILS